MSDATLRIVVDATGAIVPTQRVQAELKTLGAVGDVASNKVQGFARSGAFALSSFASSGTRDITSVLKSLSQLGFAFGAGVGTVTLLISTIADAWQDSTRKAKEEQDKQLADLLQFEQGFSANAKRVRIATLEAKEAELTGRVAQGPAGFGRGVGMERFSGIVATRNFENLKKELAEVRARLGDLRTGLNKDVRDTASAAFSDASKAAKKFRDEMVELKKSTMVDNADRVRTARQEYESAGKTGVALAKLKNEQAAVNAEVEARRTLTGDLLDASLRAIANEKMWKDAAVDSNAIAARRTKILEEQEMSLKRQKQMLLGIGVGAAAGLLASTGPLGGVIGSTVSSAVGAAAGGPWAMAAAGTVALVGGLFGLSRAARDAAREADRLRAAINAQRKQVMEEVLSQASEELAVMFQVADARQRATDAQIALKTQLKSGAISAEEYAERVKLISDWYVKTADTIAAEVAQRKEYVDRELEIRALRALGMDEYAEALAQQLANEQELTQARKDGASETQLARLAEIQRAEQLSRSMAKIQATIDSLTNSIAGLEDFRNQLLLSDDAGLSPTAKLAEARRQYDEILALTESDDIKKAQEAAGRLPGAAQTLLNLSRSVNASGPGFQSDLAKVLADNQAVINRFQDLRSIEEEMLLALKKIRDNTNVFAGPWEAPFPFTPISIPIDGDAIAENTAATVDVLQAGFQQTIAVLGAKLDSVERATRNEVALT